MEVRYASQVLSHIVAASLCTYVSISGLLQSAMGIAAQFVSKFDSLFNCVKNSTIKSQKHCDLQSLKTPHTKAS